MACGRLLQLCTWVVSIVSPMEGLEKQWDCDFKGIDPASGLPGMFDFYLSLSLAV